MWNSGKRGAYCKTKAGEYYVSRIWPDEKNSRGTESSDPVLANTWIAEKFGDKAMILSCSMGYDVATYTVNTA